jgi:F420-dependent oxidoreductase-like protein
LTIDIDFLSRQPRFGLQTSSQSCTFEELHATWTVADEASFDHVWVSDHLYPVGGAPLDGPIWEAWTLVAAAAATTSRVRIGTMVTANTYRHPSVLAKMAATVDHLSDGRLEFGIGTGWSEIEHRMLGIDFPAAGERVQRLDEACSVLELLWTRPRAEFEGRYYRLQGAIAEPKPVQRPHPPVWIGGYRPQMLGVVARHANVWTLPAMALAGAGDLEESLEVARRLSQLLDDRCTDIGRDPATIRRAVHIDVDLTAVDDSIRAADGFRAAGFGELIVNVPGTDPVTGAARAAEIVDRLRS